jgi:tetratricopeptide (TPR) repeat protein
MRRRRGLRFRPVLRGALLAYALAMAAPQGQPQAQAQSGKQIGAPLRAPAAGNAPKGPTGLETLPTRAIDLIGRAERLLASGQADEAWRMLEENAANFAGDPRFDYMLGLAAIDSGRPGQAIFALERVLMVRPDFLPARAEIARAYFMVREHENARREFASVSAERIPEAARQTIGLYLDAIQRAAQAGRPVFSLRAEFETGYDSNANFGSASGHWLLADGTGVTPLPASRPRSSTVLAGALALDASGQFSERIEWIAGARASARYFPRVPELDQQQFDVSGGLTMREGCHRWSALALLQHLQLDGSAYRNAGGAVLQWQCEINARTMVGASLQAFDLDYPSAPIRDARRTAVGVNAARVLDAPGRPILVASLAAGQESSKRDIDHLGHDFLSARVGVVARIAPNWRASANLSWERREFGGAEPIFGVVRNDRQTELRIELERKIDEQTSLVPHLVGTRNASTLSPNDFRRVQAGVLVRHRF